MRKPKWITRPSLAARDGVLPVNNNCMGDGYTPSILCHSVCFCLDLVLSASNLHQDLRLTAPFGGRGASFGGSPSSSSTPLQSYLLPSCSQSADVIRECGQRFLDSECRMYGIERFGMIAKPQVKPSVRLDWPLAWAFRSLVLGCASSIFISRVLLSSCFSYLQTVPQLKGYIDLCDELPLLPLCHKQLHLMCIRVHGSIGLVDSSLGLP